MMVERTLYYLIPAHPQPVTFPFFEKSYEHQALQNASSLGELLEGVLLCCIYYFNV